MNSPHHKVTKKVDQTSVECLPTKKEIPCLRRYIPTLSIQGNLAGLLAPFLTFGSIFERGKIETVWFPPRPRWACPARLPAPRRPSVGALDRLARFRVRRNSRQPAGRREHGGLAPRTAMGIQVPELHFPVLTECPPCPGVPRAAATRRRRPRAGRRPGRANAGVCSRRAASSEQGPRGTGVKTVKTGKRNSGT